MVMPNMNPITTDTAPDSEQLRVRVAIEPGHVAYLYPAVLLLRPLLTYRVKEFKPGGPHGYAETQEEVLLADMDTHGQLSLPAGLLHRCRQELEAHGYHVDVVDHRKYGKRFAVNEELLQAADDTQRQMLKAVIQEPLGQIETTSFTDTVEKIMLIDELYPNAKLVVAVAKREQVRQFWKALDQILGRKVGIVCGGTRKKGDGMLVCTHAFLHQVRNAERRILILPNAEGSTGDAAFRKSVEAAFGRVYAFVRPHRRVDPLAQLRLEIMAGPVIHRVRKPTAAVQVIMVPTPLATLPAPVHSKALERKRAAYWNNMKRNQTIAAVAPTGTATVTLRIRRSGTCCGRWGPPSAITTTGPAATGRSRYPRGRAAATAP